MEIFTTGIELRNPDDCDCELLQQEIHEALSWQAVKHNGVWRSARV